MSRSILEWRSMSAVLGSESIHNAHPSRTALPNGLVEDCPPRKRSHICCAKADAWLSEENPTDPVAPPKLKVTSLPLDWQVAMSLANEAQSGSVVPGKVALSTGLQV